MSERRRSLAADLVAPFSMQRRSPLDAADPVTRVWESLPALPRRYGAEVTTPNRDVSMGERPLMPRFDGAPLVTPAENANTMTHVGAASGMAGSMRLIRADQSDIIRHMMHRMQENDGSEYFGIRVAGGRPAKIGDILRPSRIWEDGTPTRQLLNGTSAVGLVRRGFSAPDENELLRALRIAGIPEPSQSYSYYPGRNVYLLRADRAEPGVDFGEMVLRNPVVSGVYRKAEDGPSGLFGFYR